MSRPDPDRRAGHDRLLDRVDTYLDAVQRDSADVEDVGPFVLFRSRMPFPLYARPRRRLDRDVTADDVVALTEHCATVGVPPALEWVVEVTPSAGPAAGAAGWAVVEHPLLVLTADAFRPAAPAPGVTVGVVDAVDDLVAARAVADVGFGAGGTAVGEAGAAARDAAIAATGADVGPALLAGVGATVTVLLADGDGPAASGVVKPVGDAAEVMGVATLPAARRRGHAAAVTSALVREAFARGVSLVLLSAEDDDVARGYERLGFVRVGRAGAAEPAPATGTDTPAADAVTTPPG